MFPCIQLNISGRKIWFNILSVEYVSGQFSANQESSISVITSSGSLRSNQANNGNIIDGVMTLFARRYFCTVLRFILHIDWDCVEYGKQSFDPSWLFPDKCH